MNQYVYVQLEDSVQVIEKNVRMKDVASVYTKDPAICNRIKSMIVYRFQNEKTKQGEKQVISLLYLTQKIQSQFPDVVVLSHGGSDCIVELIAPAQKDGKNTGMQKLKVFLISLICLFGGAFSIMAFHNDISITNIFMEFYELVTGESSNGFTVLEISYSVGLLAGILVFYNHIGKKKITPEPTPIEVSMHNYEQDMDAAIVTRWEREGKKIDVD